MKIDNSLEKKFDYICKVYSEHIKAEYLPQYKGKDTLAYYSTIENDMDGALTDLTENLNKFSFEDKVIIDRIYFWWYGCPLGCEEENIFNEIAKEYVNNVDILVGTINNYLLKLPEGYLKDMREGYTFFLKYNNGRNEYCIYSNEIGMYQRRFTTSTEIMKFIYGTIYYRLAIDFDNFPILKNEEWI